MNFKSCLNYRIIQAVNDNLARWGLSCLSGPGMNSSRAMLAGKATLVTGNGRGKCRIPVPQTIVFIR